MGVAGITVEPIFAHCCSIISFGQIRYGRLIVARRGGHVAKAARTQLESQLGHSVVSSLNVKDYFASLEQGKQEQTEKGEDKTEE